MNQLCIYVFNHLRIQSFNHSDIKPYFCHRKYKNAKHHK